DLVQLDGVWVGAVGPGRLVKSGADAQAVCISEARIGQLAPHGIPEGSLMSLDSRFEKQLRGLVGRVQVDGDALERRVAPVRLDGILHGIEDAAPKPDRLEGEAPSDPRTRAPPLAHHPP